LYANRTWSYVKEIKFNGILNNHVYSLISSNPQLNYKQSWDNEVCFTSDRKNDLGKLKDTLWLCVTEDHDDGFHIPFHGSITSRYGFRKGRYHNGIDISLKVGDTVRAAWSGKVRYAKFNEGGFGNLVIIRHYNGLESFYAHLNQHLCVPNQDVKAGDPIGLGGNTGHSFGPHLHFELRFYDAPMNPEEVIDFKNLKLKDQNLLLHKDLFIPGAKPSDFGDHGDHGEQAEATVKELTTKQVELKQVDSKLIDKKLVDTKQADVKLVDTKLVDAKLVDAKPIEKKPIVKKPVNKYHKVRSGDTLTKIALKNNTTIANLCQLNGISQSSAIQIGRNLRVK
jgi:murein DD-endopeptidase MepM/ murein hydrolase activator NlpD